MARIFSSARVRRSVRHSIGVLEIRVRSLSGPVEELPLPPPRGRLPFISYSVLCANLGRTAESPAAKCDIHLLGRHSLLR